MTEAERLLLAQVRSIRRRRCVSIQEALSLLQQVDHKMFQDALESHWQVEQDGSVTPESICWLFCWAATGINSSDTADDCKSKFNSILDRTYEWFDSNIGHEFARKFRYRKLRKIEL